MEFKTAVDRLRDCPTRESIAAAIGVSFYTVAQALLPEDSAGRRPAPAGWQSAVAELARKRSAELAKLADRIERGG